MSEESLKNESNTTDATVGQSLRARVAARKAELEAAIASPTTDARTRSDLQMALSGVEGLLTGDLDQIPKVVAAGLSAWLEANKHLDEHHLSPTAPVAERCEPAPTAPVAEQSAPTAPVAERCEPAPAPTD